jgi:Flp pilus assembly protein TadB
VVTARVAASLAATASTLTLVTMVGDTRARRRLRALAPPPDRGPHSALIAMMGHALDLVSAIGRLARRLVGRPPDRRRDRQVGAAVGLLVVGSLVHPLVGVLAACGPWAARIVARRRSARRHADRLLDDLPDVVDLFRVAAGGGLTVHHAVRAVADVVDGPVGAALAEVNRRVLLGERLVEALTSLGQLGAPARPLMSALVSAERDGASLTWPLERAADHARDVRRRRAEERARRVPVQLLFPLVLCVLPAFALLTVVPLLAGTLQSLSP